MDACKEKDNARDAAEQLRSIFETYASNCKHFKLDSTGKVASSCKIEISKICVDKSCNVYVEWKKPVRFFEITSITPVNKISNAQQGYVEGIFFDEASAVEAAKKHFDEQKARRIAKLEKELAALRSKKECS